MQEEIEPAPTVRPRVLKAIPETRDRWQGRLLVLLVAASISACIVFGFLATGEQGGRYKVAGASLALAIIAAGMRSATIIGAVCGALACFCMTWWTRDLETPLQHSALPALVALVVFTFLATRAGRKQKQVLGLSEQHGGRTAAQVMANLGVAALVVTPLGAYAGDFAGLSLPVAPLLLAAASLAALAEATADTVSSEIGQAFGTRTYLLTNLRRVHRGTDGGVSAQGTTVGLLAALVVVLIGGWALRLTPELEALAFSAGLIGFAADSLLGATIERRGWIGNDLVNFLSTAVAAFSVLLMARFTSASH